MAQPSPPDAAASGRAADAATTGTPVGDRKLRLLCLHGYMQNASVFRSRVGSLRKALKSRAEFFFVDAPYAAEPGGTSLDDDGGSGAQGLSWWRWTDLEPGTRPSRAAHYSGWEASQAVIEAALQQHAPVDGLLGFSQGATAAALYLAHTEPAAGARRHDGLRFSVHVAGFLPRDASYAAALQKGRPSLPSLHVHGAADALVPEERSAALWACFAPCCVRTFKHPGAHMVPTCSGEFKRLMVELLDEVTRGGGGGAVPAESAAAAAAAARDQACGSNAGCS